ncbi:taurine transport system permease protein [Rhodoligotrophos appendicifer]|uniref:ABC transporter permease n=1 Tax=Rhodoligotrophos appendicifer TaxID=987056 RepID=UPI0011854771|nr:ABC transporter permease [Rhodoligotrophos appendicifer]
MIDASTGHSAKRWRLPDRLGYLAISAVSALVFIALWEGLAATGIIDPEFFPPPTHVWTELKTLISDGTLLTDILASAIRVVVGFALSAVVGIALGILLGTVEVVRWIVQPIISIIRPLPSLAWIPLSLLWLGIGEEQKYAIVFMGTLAPLTVFVTDATLRVDPLYIRAARNLGASKLAVMWEVILPAALPSIVSALKVTLALAWTCIISAEMVGANDGLGFLIWNAKDWSNVSQVICGMLAISVTVLVLDTILRSVEHRFIPWQRGVKRQVRLI